MEGNLSVAQDRQRTAQVVRLDASITLLVNYATPLACSSPLFGALAPGFVALRQGAVIEVTGKAAPTEDAAWTGRLLVIQRTGSLH